MFISTAYAQQAPAAQPSFFEQAMPFAFLIIIFYVFILRPQAKRQKFHQSFIQNLKRGDSVLTSGGILGTIEGLTDKFVTLEVADGVRIRILKAQISSPVVKEEK